MRVLGIDPGLRSMGWGIVDVDGPRLSHVANGQCKGGTGDLSDRLLRLFDQLSAVIAEHDPSHAAVEQTFVNKDGASTLKLGQARGIAMLVPAQAGLSVAEYAPNAVKKAVVGVGHADKRQVEHMVKLQLPGCQPAGADAADALAIAICHSFHAASAGRLVAAIDIMPVGQAIGIAVPFLILAAIVGGLLYFTAWVQARATVYTVTNKRVAMRIGAALTVTLNLPYTQIDSADLDLRKNGVGTIALTTKGEVQFAYLVLWPHVRPWRFPARPALRCIPNAERVARLLAEAAEARVSMPQIGPVSAPVAAE